MANASTNMSYTKTIFLFAMVSLGWGLSFLAIAILLEAMAPAQMLAARWSMMAVLFLVLILMGKIPLQLKGKNLFFLFLTGLCEPCAYCILEAYGIKMTSASVSAIFVATIPCMTLVLGALLFHLKVNRTVLAGIILAFLGVVLATVCSPAFSLGGTRIGMVCMAAAVVAASMYTLSSSRASADFDPLSVTAVMCMEGAVFFDIVCFCQGYGFQTFLIPFTDGKLLFCMLFLVLFCAYASYVCYNRLVSYVDPALAANVSSSLSTVIGVVAGILVTHDTWGWYTIVGMALAIAGVWISGRRMQV